jgi:hypothetical protein
MLVAPLFDRRPPQEPPVEDEGTTAPPPGGMDELRRTIDERTPDRVTVKS